LTTLLREFERIGYAVTVERDKKTPIVIRSRSGELKFVLFEPMRRVRRPVPVKDGEGSVNQKPQFRHENPWSKELVLRIDSHVETGEQSEWRDSVETPLEEQINEAVRGLLTAMALAEDREEKARAEEQRRWKLQESGLNESVRRRLKQPAGDRWYVSPRLLCRQIWSENSSISWSKLVWVVPTSVVFRLYFRNGSLGPETERTSSIRSLQTQLSSKALRKMPHARHRSRAGCTRSLVAPRTGIRIEVRFPGGNETVFPALRADLLVICHGI